MPDPYQIAAWRFEQIAPYLDSSIDLARRRSLMRHRAAVTWPNGRKQRIPRSTLHRWTKAYQQSGLEGLLPSIRKDLGRTRVGSRSHIDFAVGLLLEQPTRSLLQLDLYLRHHLADYDLSLPTLRRRLRAHPARAAIEAARTGKQRRLRDRYEAKHPHECWQLDGKGPFTVRFVDGTTARVHVLTILDDCSRAVLATHIAAAEDTVAAITVFQKAAARYGLPDRMQFDRGSAFDSDAFRTGLAHCGVHRNFVRARHPEAQGKIEAYHRSLQRWFVDELRTQEVHDLIHLQELLEATIALVYQRHRHRSIGVAPEQKLGTAQSARCLSAAELARAFYIPMHARSESKTGIVKLANGSFRVPLAFAGTSLLFRYDPLRPVAVLVTKEHREIALEASGTRELPKPRSPKHGKGRLQKLVDDFRGRQQSNAEPAFGLPEVFTTLADALGRPVPASAREAHEVQDFWRLRGPLSRRAFVAACQRSKKTLGDKRPLAVLLADIARQILRDTQTEGHS